MDGTFQVPDAAAASGSFLQRWLCSSSGSSASLSLRTEPDHQVPVAVIGIHRYLSPPQPHPTPHQHQSDSAHTSYDVTLTDGACRTKCLLHHSLNGLVCANALRSGVDVVVTDYRFVYDERRVGRGHVCITKVTLCGSSSVLPTVSDANSLPLVAAGRDGVGTPATALQHDTTPLQLSRKHYLPLWNDEDPEGSVWRGASHDGPPSDVVLDVSKIILVSELESCAGYQRKLPPLLVRILQKSRLRYYGRPGHKIDYPYQAYFEVADHSGIMSLVLWNELCPEWYQRLGVGMVLYLQGYTLKESYSKRTRPQMQQLGTKTFHSVEIGLNAWSPTATITVVPPKCVPSQWGLPEVSYQFTSRSDLDSVSPGFACDVIGLVTFVSRVQRLKETCKTKGSEGPDKYWTYRWVHAVDGTSKHPFILQIFSSSRPDVFNAVCPMTYLVCTQMRVLHVKGSLPYLTSSCETEIFITGGHKGQPYVSDQTVKSFLQWTKTLKDNVTMHKCVVGGHYCFPHPPETFTQPVAIGSAVTPLVAAAELKMELESLQYREHRSFAVQGHIMAVTYLTCPKSPDPNQEQVTEQSGGVSAPPHGDQRTEEPPAHVVSANKRKRQPPNSMEGGEQEERRSGTQSEEDRSPSPSADLQVDPGEGDGGLSWESTSWPLHRAELSDHLCRGGLFQDSLTQRFHYDDKDRLLHWTNLHPGHWTPGQPTHFCSNVACPGYYQLTIMGLNRDIAIDAAFLPVASVEDPRAAGMVRDPRQDPQPDTLLSCLLSGFLCPPSDPATPPPRPEDIVSTAEDMKDTPLVWVLDVCHLGADRLEVLISRVHRVS